MTVLFGIVLTWASLTLQLHIYRCGYSAKWLIPQDDGITQETE